LADAENLWQFVLTCLERSIPVGLLVVMESRGSTPGKAGAKMAVTADGEMVGTIGGGRVEQQWVEQAQKMLCQGAATQAIVRQEHHADASGMICGGVQTILLHVCLKKDESPIESLLRALQHQTTGLLRIDPAGIAVDAASPLNTVETAFHHEGEDDWRYLETIGIRHTAYLVGGGHVSLALSRILNTLDFHVVVFDERPELHTLVDNSYAHEKIIAPFEKIHRQIPEGEHHYAVIMTPSHASDERVLGNLIDKRLRFLGMLGSKTKVAAIMENLSRQFPPEKLRRVHAPVGLPIKSHTPAEIAVSIAAEMIQVKNTVESETSGIPIPR